ncbi:DUF1192 family protein [Nitratireductor mangrovi]|uniref:DUF1192 family protein n=1 Tax=Nitratireductor mangrovi TaxID=2599600 RepID=A0A5B8KWT0_9HYPH|nr:DUF1192 domain-containing protein [Nitratireductor mangrovi]QDZ00026.1 DUF1192 family protein [Nitratireductor mangrovi]
MSFPDEESRAKTVPHEIGQDLSLLSVDELAQRIGVLRAEIDRLEADMKEKGSTKAAAEALFRRG